MGSLVTFGAGAVSSSSNNQKSNTKSSTQTKIIALHDKLSDVIWMRYFANVKDTLLMSASYFKIT